jgi:hypothetical protein
VVVLFWVNTMGYTDEDIKTDATVNEIYLASINNQEVVKLGVKIKQDFETHTETSLNIAFRLLANESIKQYKVNYADET